MSSEVATSKPPYRIPSMREIQKVRGTNGLTVVSTFSGCGGSCLGFEMAGYEILWASEFVEAAREVYKANHPGVHVDERDVRELSGSEVLEKIGKKVGEVDVLEGSPPCASFSMAGRRSGAWGKVKGYSDTKQRTDDLFFEYSRLVGEIKPRVFVAENVAGLVQGDAKGYFKQIVSSLSSHGYLVEARLLNSQWLGVPQARQRLIFVGVREDMKAEPSHPTPQNHFYTIREAWKGLMDTSKRFSLIGWNGENYDRKGIHFNVDRPAPTIIANPYQLRVEGDGGEVYQGPGKHVTQGSRARYSKLRDITIAELKRLCGFPDDFQLSGRYARQWERLGRSVPPPMMRAVAEVVRDKILERQE